ncbi:MAG: alanine racemase [Acidobacteriota bacterium]|nr:alanine racemase [Acidobacteriota bacterium]
MSSSSKAGPTLENLATPCAVVDLDAVERNVETMARRMESLGVRLRPHVKTHKCVELGRLQSPDGRITVSTLAEARHFAADGFRDITWALPLDPQRLPEIAELKAEVDAFHLLLDEPRTLDALESYARNSGPGGAEARFSAFLKVDCGYHRAGVDPASPAALELTRRLAASSAVRFAGILTHAGHSYSCRTDDEVAAVAEQERSVMADFAAELRRRGLEVPEVSVGSTPTMTRVRSLEGITEARPGNYVFFDLHQEAIGSCRRRDVALSVLATVVGCYPERGQLVLNVGSLALSKDRGAVHVPGFEGYGELVEEGGGGIEGLELVSLSQEHGQVRTASPELARRYPVGTRLRVLPNHSCLTAALFDRYHVVRGQRVVEEWRPVRGW